MPLKNRDGKEGVAGRNVREKHSLATSLPRCAHRKYIFLLCYFLSSHHTCPLYNSHTVSTLLMRIYCIFVCETNDEQTDWGRMHEMQTKGKQDYSRAEIVCPVLRFKLSRGYTHCSILFILLVLHVK